MKKLLLFFLCIPFLGVTQTHTINTVGNAFSPSSLTVNIGDTVNWNNTGGFHNVNGTQTTFPNNPQSFGNGVAPAPWSFQWIFTLAGTYAYQCDPHAAIGMTGVVIVNLPGCMDSTACNYDSLATVDDGSCILPGCTDSLACNYDSLATCDDGSCNYQLNSSIDLTTGTWNYLPDPECDQIYNAQPLYGISFNSTGTGFFSGSYPITSWSLCNNIFIMNYKW